MDVATCFSGVKFITMEYVEGPDLNSLIRANGTWVATPFPTQDSSMLTPLAAANCLVIRPPFAPAAEAGTACSIVKLHD